MISIMKFPRTYHLPFSECLSSDDKRIKDTSIFEGREIVVTEKLDGENFSLYHNQLHARSEDSKHHLSRSWIKQFHSRIKYLIPPNVQICGENLFAKHSIFYSNLPNYFLVFAILRDNIFLSWDETRKICTLLNIPTVPVLYWG